MDLPLACPLVGWLMTYQGPREGGKEEGGKKKKENLESHLAKSNQIQISVLGPNAADIEAQG